MLARCLVIQLWKDVVTSKEHCKRTFCKEGYFPAEYLKIKEEPEQLQMEGSAGPLIKLTITFSYTFRRQWSKIPILAQHMILSSATSQIHLNKDENFLILPHPSYHHITPGLWWRPLAAGRRRWALRWREWRRWCTSGWGGRWGRRGGGQPGRTAGTQ